MSVGCVPLDFALPPAAPEVRDDFPAYRTAFFLFSIGGLVSGDCLRTFPINTFVVACVNFVSVFHERIFRKKTLGSAKIVTLFPTYDTQSII